MSTLNLLNPLHWTDSLSRWKTHFSVLYLQALTNAKIDLTVDSLPAFDLRLTVSQPSALFCTLTTNPLSFA